MAAKKKKKTPKKPSSSRRAPSTRARPTKRRAPLKAKRPASKKPRRAQRPSRPAAENPEALAMAKEIAAVVLDKKGDDVVILDVRERGGAVGYDYVVLASGASDRQLEAMEDALRERFGAHGRRATSVEASPDWVLMNFDDVVAHFFTPDKRRMYDLEGLWSDAPRVEVPA